MSSCSAVHVCTSVVSSRSRHFCSILEISRRSIHLIFPAESDHLFGHTTANYLRYLFWVTRTRALLLTLNEPSVEGYSGSKYEWVAHPSTEPA
jgi:hypothetical protein